MSGAWGRAAVVVALTGLVLVVVGALVWGLQRRLIYFPGRDALPPAAQVLDGARDVELRTSDGLSLVAWYLPAAGGDTDDAVTALVAHGNGGDVAGRASLARALAAHGLGVLLLEYRGYGGNPGNPTEVGLALDARAARDFLVREAGITQDRLLYFGESLGAAVVTELAVDHPPAGLLLRSPFTSLAAVGHEHYPFLPLPALLRDEYPLVEHLRRLPVPTTVVLGTHDTIVPPEHSRAVADAAPRLHELIEVNGADHNDPALVDGPQLVDAVVSLADLARDR